MNYWSAGSFCLAKLVLFLGIIITPTLALAQNSSPNLHLDENHILLKSVSKPGNRNKSLSKYSNGRKPNASELSLDSADEIIMDPERGQTFFQTYRGLIYLKYFGNWDDLDEEDPTQSKSFAKQILLYHGAQSFSDYIKNSPLRENFENLISEFKKYKRYTTVSVDESSSGSIAVRQGKENDSPILKFKLGISTKRGVEPKLSLLDVVTFRYDILDQQTVVEYRIDF